MSLLVMFMIIFLIIIVIGILNEKLMHIPNDIALVLFSTVIGVAVLLLSNIDALSFLRKGTDVFRNFDFESYLLKGVLCFMLFAGASKLHFSKFVSNIKMISLLALLTTVVSSLIYGILFYLTALLLGIHTDIWMCILLGCIVSPTDPIAATSILNKLGLSKNVSSVIEGESLFNDGTGVALFVFVRSIVLTNQSGNGESENFFLLMSKEIFGSVAVALLFSFLTFLLLKKTRDPLKHIFISVFNVSCVYIICEHFGFSGVMASVVCGMYYAYNMDKIRRQRCVSDIRNLYEDFWDIIDTILNSVLFVLIGLSVITMDFNPIYIGILAASVIIAIASRAAGVTVSGLLTRRKKIPSGYSIPEYMILMTWSALKGGLSLALALSTSGWLPSDTYNLFINITYITILFTVIVQGLTVGKAYRFVEKSKAARMKKRGIAE